MFARIDGRDIPLASCSVVTKQNEVGSIDLVVPAKAVDQTRLRFANISIFRRGMLVASGINFDAPQRELNNTRTLLLRLKAMDDLGRLTCYAADTTAHFQDQSVVSIITTLLAQTGGDWAISDVSTMIDPAVTTTVDLRSKESLWAQITEAVRSVPKLFIRYGGYIPTLNKHQLELGFFGSKLYNLTQGDNLVSLSAKINSQRLINQIEAYADVSGDQRVTLADALNDPRTASHLDFGQFPIMISNGRYVVVNKGQPYGCAIAKAYNAQKTKNDQPPTNAEIAAVGFAIWQRAVRDLQRKSEYNTYSATGMFPTFPRVGDKAFVSARLLEDVYDHVAHCTTQMETFELTEWERITQIKIDFQTAAYRRSALDAECYEDVDSIGLEMTDNDYAEQDDPEIELYESLERFDANDKIEAKGIAVGVKGVEVKSVTHGAGDPADGACAPGTAKEYVFTPSAVPVGATAVYGTVINRDPASATVTITQFPALPATPMKICVSVGGTWPPASPVTITVRFDYL